VMHTKDDVITLANIGDGAAMEMFDVELRKVLKNIMDPNTDPKATRQIVMQIGFKADEDRDMAVISISVASKLSGARSYMTKVVFGRDDRGRVEAREFDLGQQQLFSNVVPICKEGE